MSTSATGTTSWAPCHDLSSYVALATDHTQGAPVPVLVADRPDLESRLDEADLMYEVLDDGPRSGSVVTFGLDDELRRAVTSLLRHRVEAVRESIESYVADPRGDLVVVGRHADLHHDVLESARVAAEGAGAEVRVLTGRDAASLAWLVAKQLVRRRGSLTGGAVVSGTANLQQHADAEDDASAEVTVIGSREVETADVDHLLLDRGWRQVIFHGHGTENSINLGEYTVCGRNDQVPDASVVEARPRCGYGLGCYKSDDTLIPLDRLRAAHVVMASCCNATFTPNRVYDARYLLLLNGIDGLAQSMLVSPVVHDVDNAELTGWVSAVRRDELVSVAPDLSDIHPFPTFVHVGLSAPGDEPVALDRAHVPDASTVAELAATLQGYLASDLVADSHPLHGGMRALARKIEAHVARSVRGTTARWETLQREVRADVQSLDLRLAKAVARNPEDPILDFPQYFGDRSEVDPATVTPTRCMCGREAVEWERRPLLHHLLRTRAMVCPRCGDVRFATPGAPTVELSMQEEMAVGDTLEARVSLTSARDGSAQVGVFVPGYMRDAYPTPPPTKVRLRRGERTELDIEIVAADDLTPQAYYATVFVVSDLTLATVRQRFALLPRGGVDA